MERAGQGHVRLNQAERPSRGIDERIKMKCDRCSAKINNGGTIKIAGFEGTRVFSLCHDCLLRIEANVINRVSEVPGGYQHELYLSKGDMTDAEWRNAPSMWVDTVRSVK